MPGTLDTLLAIAAGLGLAAACGFRVFVPLLVVSVAGRAGLLEVHQSFDWITSWPTIVCFGVATVLEVGAYYVPVVDNLLDAVATPAAAVAGAVVASAVIVDVEPWLRWTLVIVAGAGLATAVQVPTAATRAGSTLTTAGVGTPVVSTGEAMGAAMLSGLAVFAPVLIPVVLVLLVLFVLRLRPGRA